MPNPNAIVGAITRIDFPVIEFEGQRRARLDPQVLRQAEGVRRILEELQRRQLPAYVEVTPDTGAISRLLIPLLVKIVRVSDSRGDEIDVELEISQARHFLRRNNRYYDELLQTLRGAENKDVWLAVTAADDHEIIDARPYRAPPSEPGPPGAQHIEAMRLPWWRRLFWCWRCIPARRVRQMFALVGATTCDPLTVPPPCIPFLYPDDGCWGRAHEMCRLMLAAGATPRKVWIYGNLRVNTRNNPNCFVQWGWHVAPTLCVRHWCFWKREEVIDPALFTKPVSEGTWKGVQGDRAAQLVGTDATIFYRSSGGSTQTDPTYSQTATVLANYRLQLQNRSLALGPPPYASCP
jgi:hypothetical protein